MKQTLMSVAQIPACMGSVWTMQVNSDVLVMLDILANSVIKKLMNVQVIHVRMVDSATTWSMDSSVHVSWDLMEQIVSLTLMTALENLAKMVVLVRMELLHTLVPAPLVSQAQIVRRILMSVPCHHANIMVDA